MTRVHKQILGGILVVSVLLRVLAALYLGNSVEVLPGTFDQVSYHNLALRLVDGYGFSFGKAWWPATAAGAPTAHWSFLYTFYLASIYKVFGAIPLLARIIQAILVGLAQPGLAFLLGRKVFGPASGLAAAAVTAIYAYFIYYSATLMTEPFYICAILASLYLAILMAERKSDPKFTGERASGVDYRLAAGLGLGLGAAVLLRQLFLIFIPFLFLWIWLSSRRRQLLPLLLSGGIILALIIPFTVYNYRRFERFVLLNTNAGFAFYWGNHPIYGTHFEPILPPRMGTYQELIPKELLSLDEAALDQALLRRGIQFVLDDPWRYALLSISRIAPYFVFWPSSGSGMISNLSRVSSFGLFLPFMLYGIFRSFAMRQKPLWMQPVFLLYLFMGLYTLVHILTWTLVRYRLPVDAILVLFAGLALVDLASRVPALKKLALAIGQSEQAIRPG